MDLDLDPFTDSGKCEWLRSPAAMSSSAVDCIVINYVGEDTSANWDPTTYTLTVKRSNDPSVNFNWFSATFGRRWDRDVWNGLATCKIYINPKTFQGDIILNPTTTQGLKTRVFANYVDSIYDNRPQTGVSQTAA